MIVPGPWWSAIGMPLIAEIVDRAAAVAGRTSPAGAYRRWPQRSAPTVGSRPPRERNGARPARVVDEPAATSWRPRVETGFRGPTAPRARARLGEQEHVARGRAEQPGCPSRPAGAAPRRAAPSWRARPGSIVLGRPPGGSRSAGGRPRARRDARRGRDRALGDDRALRSARRRRRRRCADPRSRVRRRAARASGLPGRANRRTLPIPRGAVRPAGTHSTVRGRGERGVFTCRVSGAGARRRGLRGRGSRVSRSTRDLTDAGRLGRRVGAGDAAEPGVGEHVAVDVAQHQVVAQLRESPSFTMRPSCTATTAAFRPLMRSTSCGGAAALGALRRAAARRRGGRGRGAGRCRPAVCRLGGSRRRAASPAAARRARRRRARGRAGRRGAARAGAGAGGAAGPSDAACRSRAGGRRPGRSGSRSPTPGRWRSASRATAPSRRILGVVVGEDRRVQVVRGAGRAQIARGGEDRVDRVVGVGIAGVQGVDPVLQPGPGMNCIQPTAPALETDRSVP